MDINKFNEFRDKIDNRLKNVERSLNHVDAKISYLHDALKGVKKSHNEFQEEMTDFMSFMAEGLADHETRISSIEKKLG